MIPGFLITWATFPGVIVHELAHAMFCRLFGIPIYAIKYFQFTTGFGSPAGYVIHGRPKSSLASIMISIGPFFLNSIVGAVIASPAVFPVMRFGGGDLLDLFLMWLGLSVAMHAFPSTGDAKAMWSAATGPGSNPVRKLVAAPFVGLIYLGAIGSVFWLDAIYGFGVINALPNLIVKLFV